MGRVNHEFSMLMTEYWWTAHVPAPGERPSRPRGLQRQIEHALGPFQFPRRRARGFPPQQQIQALVGGDARQSDR
jgi:hypothetical protein